MAGNDVAKIPDKPSKEHWSDPELQLRLSPTIVGSLSSISCGTLLERDEGSDADCEEHRGSISPLDYLARAQDPASLNQSPPPAGAAWHYRYTRRPTTLAGCCLLSTIGLVTLASVLFLAYMFIRHNEKVYALVWRLVAAVFSHIFRSD
ncbi:hypothetical protein V5799_031978 [Amblyomma americanum]|uniref:Uncharacterized protein n=1 Tax=Amblyomma americanum TaxID=6943 RepID=A0AAQ4DSH4_AMBAM